MSQALEILISNVGSAHITASIPYFPLFERR